MLRLSKQNCSKVKEKLKNINQKLPKHRILHYFHNLLELLRMYGETKQVSMILTEKFEKRDKRL